MPTTTVSKTVHTDDEGNEQIQYRTTVPKQLAEAFNMEGCTLEWETLSQTALRISIKDE